MPTHRKRSFIKLSRFVCFSIKALTATLLLISGNVLAGLAACPQTAFDLVDTSTQDKVVGNARISDDGNVVAYVCGIDICIKDFSVEPPLLEVLQADIETNPNFRHFYPDLDETGNTILYAQRSSSNVYLLYVHHRDTGLTELVTIDTDGNPAPDNYRQARISLYGKHVVFQSGHENLVVGDSNNDTDVFVRDLENSETRLVSVSSSGAQGNRRSGTSESSNMERLDISATGEIVVFVSDATNLIANDTNDTVDIFLRDIIKGTTKRVGLRPDGNELYYGADSPALSNFGQFVAFRASPYEIGQRNVYLHNLLSGKVERISVPLSGVAAEDESPTSSSHLEITENGQYVYFQSKADDLVPGDDNGGIFEGVDIFVRDTKTRQTRLLSYEQDIDGHCVRAGTASLVSIDRYGTTITYSANDIDKIYRVGLDITPPLVDAVDVSPEDGSQLSNFQVSATLKDRVILDNAEYRIDADVWVPMAVQQNSEFSSEASVDFIGSGLSFGLHQVCVRTYDAYGNKGQNCTEFRIVEAASSTTDTSIKCYHHPLIPQPGEDVEYFAEVLDTSNQAKSVDAVEIWVNDHTAPAKRVESRGSTSVVQVATGAYQTYGCRAEVQGVEIFSGWRLHATTDWSLTRAIPIAKTGILENRIDIVLVPDRRTYDSANDLDFLDAASQLLFNGYWGDFYWRGHQDKFNFWISLDMGEAESYEDGCDHLLPGEPVSPLQPSIWQLYYAFADTAAIVHSDSFRDCAPGGRNVFSTDLDNMGTVRHESGHRPFGMPDEYADDGGYYVISPYTTLYDSLASCENDLKNLDAENLCTSFISSHDDKRWWRSDPQNDHQMSDNLSPRSGDRRRMEWLFRRCAKGDC